MATKVASEFHSDNSSSVKLLFGCVGCGKSSAACNEIFYRSIQQAKDKYGIRRTRWGIFRNNYPQLKTTTIRTWEAWFPPKIFGKIKWDSPIAQVMQFEFEGGKVEIEIDFVSFENEKEALEKLKSAEYTGIWINELQYCSHPIFNEAIDRYGRYPEKNSGIEITWKGLICDTNPPPESHWIHKLFEEQKPDGFKIFKYEPALVETQIITPGIEYAISLDGTIWINNPKADFRNCQNDQNYWLSKVPGKTDAEIKVKYCGEYGITIKGKPVHPEYNDNIHFSNRVLQYNPHIELGLGFDFGLNPACAIIQIDEHGRLLILGEVIGEDCGLEQFIDNQLLFYLNQYFPRWEQNYASFHDPAGQTGVQTDQKSCQQILLSKGIRSYPAAQSNAVLPRRAGIKYFLTKLINGKPACLVSSRAQKIREGLSGDFQYPKINTASMNDNLYREKPIKNMASHICEGLEYIVMQYHQATIPNNFIDDDMPNLAIQIV